MSAPNVNRPAIAALSVGFALTVAATILPFLGHPAGQMIAAHIKAGYPSYSSDRIQTAVTIYLVALSAIGVLGAIGWIIAIAAVRAGKQWASWLATVAFLVGASIGLFDLLARDTSGDTGLSPVVGWLGLLPSAAGLIAVLLLWMRSPTRTTQARAV